MRPRALLVAHPEAMAAEALAAALERHAALAPVAVVTSAPAAEACAERVDAAVLDRRLRGCRELARTLRRRGVRVVVIGETDEDDYGVSVAPGSSVSELAAALAPGTVARTLHRRPLTHREHQVLTLAGRGFAAKHIARHLGISSKTVEQHKSRAFRKLGVPNQAAAISLIASTSHNGSLTSRSQPAR
ncbi:MAG: helix-turn-helix transcriptional regulator [Actinomycetota bacterium]